MLVVQILLQQLIVILSIIKLQFIQFTIYLQETIFAWKTFFLMGAMLMFVLRLILDSWLSK